MSRSTRGAVTFLGLLVLWQAIVLLTDVPDFILPSPAQVLEELTHKHALILPHAGTTLLEILLGLSLGTLLGGASALVLVSATAVRRWLMPVLVASQALPVFALAPLLVLWLGYGLASKIAMATLIIYFPVAAAFYDGLRRIDPGWLDLARVMGGDKTTVLWLIRLPAALPAFASGLRVATAVASIGAWWGSGSDLPPASAI